MTTPGSDNTRPGLGTRAIAVLVPLVLFAVAFAGGTAVNRAAASDEPSREGQSEPAPAEPSALPTKSVLLPGIQKPGRLSLRTDVRQVYVVGKAGLEGGSAFDDLGLPFAVRELGPEGWYVVKFEESSYAIYRAVQADRPPNVVMNIWIAAHPCKDLAGCLADRPAFDSRWTKRFKAARPATARDAQTWYTETKTADPPSYAVSMTRIFRSPATNSWWLVGAEVSTKRSDMFGLAQAFVNDIRTQTS
jgi:hypothetical protein